MSCVRSSEGGFQVVFPFGICGPVNSELSMSNRIRLSKFRFTLLYQSTTLYHSMYHLCSFRTRTHTTAISWHRLGSSIM